MPDFTSDELAGMCMHLEALRELLADVRDTMPAHLEQQQQAVIDGERGARAALQWLSTERKRAEATEPPRADRRNGDGDVVLRLHIGSLTAKLVSLEVKDLQLRVERL
ncbi:MAG: hypothetical protein ACREN2_02205 [Candidatus Dormibacteria bacterium]